MKDVQGFETFIKIEPVNKGWSADKKYYIETTDFKRLLLRIADISAYDRKKSEYAMIERLTELGIPMSLPVAFGICNQGESVYSLLTWCDGEDAEAILPTLTETEQYVLGLQAGEILQRIHSIPAPESQEEWSIRFNRKSDLKIKKYRECGIRFDGDNAVIEYIERNRVLLEGRPQCYQHGDYHVGNMIISGENALSVIDWNRSDYGDPWEEFNRIVWSATVSPYFASGQLIGYFGGKPPLEFFRLLVFYIASNTLSSIYWAISFGQAEVDIMMKQSQDVLHWFDGMKNPMPTWNIEDFLVQYIDGIPYKLKAPFDMSFINILGTVFKVFDDQDSGNICFGVQNGIEKYFVKFAGAKTHRGILSPDDAIAQLKKSVAVYHDLAHENLIKLIAAEDVGGGFALIFEWTDGECFGRMYPLSRARFMQMSLETKLHLFDDILSFHAFVVEQGYVAIDFYDGSILYDFQKAQTFICDIDFYEKRPYVNRMGRLLGSSRYMSPEEYTQGLEIDEITNVYAMGASAFALFANYNRDLDQWPLTEKLYAVAKKAVSENRDLRQKTIRQLMDEWAKAKQNNSGLENLRY